MKEVLLAREAFEKRIIAKSTHFKKNSPNPALYFLISRLRQNRIWRSLACFERDFPTKCKEKTMKQRYLEPLWEENKKNFVFLHDSR